MEKQNPPKRKQTKQKNSKHRPHKLKNKWGGKKKETKKNTN